MPKHAIDLLSLLGLFQYGLALEVVESVGDSSTHFFDLLGLSLQSLVHKLLIAKTRDQLQLNSYEEEGDTFEHHGG